MHSTKVQLILLCVTFTVHSLSHSAGRDNPYHNTPIPIQHLKTRRNESRSVFTDIPEGSGNSTSPNDESTENPLTLPYPFQNLSNSLGGLEENPSSIIGILLNRTGGFKGYTNKTFNLNDAIEGFPNSSGIILSSLENLQNNKNLQLLLQLIGAPDGIFGTVNNGMNSFSGWWNQLHNRTFQWQKIFQRLPYAGGIFSTPFGTIFHPFPVNISRSTFSNIRNLSEAFTRMAASISRLPFLSGVFLRPQEILNYLLNDGWSKSLPMFFGPEEGFQILERIFNSIASQGNNFNLPTNAPSFLDHVPIINNIAKYWNKNGINSGEIPGIGGTPHILNSVRGILSNYSNLRNMGQGRVVVRDLPDLTEQWMGNNTSANLTQLYDILSSFTSAGNRYSELIRNLTNYESLPNVSSGISDLNNLLNRLDGFFPGFSNTATPSFIDILNGIRTIFNNGITPPPAVKELFERIHKTPINISNKKDGASGRNAKVDVSNSGNAYINGTVERNTKSKDHQKIGKHGKKLKFDKLHKKQLKSITTKARAVLQRSGTSTSGTKVEDADLGSIRIGGTGLGDKIAKARQEYSSAGRADKNYH